MRTLTVIAHDNANANLLWLISFPSYRRGR
jgi:hypothetical protein